MSMIHNVMADAAEAEDATLTPSSVIQEFIPRHQTCSFFFIQLHTFICHFRSPQT